MAFALLAVVVGCDKDPASEAEAEPERENPQIAVSRQPERTTPTKVRPAPEASGSVTFSFDWPDGLRARVQATRVVAREGGRGFSSESRWDMEVAKTGSTVRIASSSYGIGPVRATVLQDQINGMLMFRMFLPSMSVGPEGQFEEMTSFGSTRADIVSAVEGVSSPEARRDPNWTLVEQSMARQPIEAAVRNSWLTLVEGLAGKEMEFGQGVPVFSSVTLPTGEPHTFPADYLMVGRVPCYDGAPSSDCVWIECEAMLSRDEILRVAEQSPVADRPDLLAALESAGDMGVSTVLVTHAVTLVPHWSRTTRSNQFSVPTANGVPRLIRERHVEELIFSYELTTLP